MYAKAVALGLLVSACVPSANNPDPVSNPACLAALNVYNETAERYLRQDRLGTLDAETWAEAEKELLTLDIIVEESCEDAQ